jgi:hypothetical protein
MLLIARVLLEHRWLKEAEGCTKSSGGHGKHQAWNIRPARLPIWTPASAKSRTRNDTVQAIGGGPIPAPLVLHFTIFRGGDSTIPTTYRHWKML